MRAVLGVLLLTGCHVVLGLERDVDALDTAAPCTRGDPFPAGVAVPLAGSWGVEAARLNAAQNFAYLALYPWPGNKSMTELYTSPFNAVTGTFSGFSKINGISFGSYDSYPAITPDDAHIVFASNRGGGQLAIWVAAATNGSFDAPALSMMPLPTGRSNANEPYVLDGGTVYFAAGGNTKWDLYRAHGPPPTFGPATLVPGVASGDHEFAPVVSTDELEIFFASNRAKPATDDALDIYTATRSAADQPFASVTAVATISTSGIDWPVWLSPDGCDLYYINKPSSTGRAELLLARRPPRAR